MREGGRSDCLYTLGYSYDCPFIEQDLSGWNVVLPSVLSSDL